jgi:phosphatidylglycerophosphatase A
MISEKVLKKSTKEKSFRWIFLWGIQAIILGVVGIWLRSYVCDFLSLLYFGASFLNYRVYQEFKKNELL